MRYAFGLRPDFGSAYLLYMKMTTMYIYLLKNKKNNIFCHFYFNVYSLKTSADRRNGKYIMNEK